MVAAGFSQARRIRDFLRLPALARRIWWEDHSRRLGDDPGALPALRAALDWMGRAQDCSTTSDGGVARHFGLRDGWGASYPETTGYIIPTFLHAADHLGDPGLRVRAQRMLDWLVSIQLADGGFQGGTIDAGSSVSVTFNTGQILLGLAEGTRVLGDRYRPALQRAGDWLVASQDPDGCWRRHPTPFARRGEKAYETHVAWGLLEAARVEPRRGYAESAIRNITWALSKQQANGWFADCCLNDPVRPLTHTLGYVLRGILEGHRFRPDPHLLESGRLTGDAMLACQRPDGSIPGRLDREWKPAVRWVCLTGVAQIAACWFYLHRATGERRYLEGALAGTAFVRRTVRMSGHADLKGGVKGSHPVSGGYGAYEYLNWAAKFLADSCLLELHTRLETRPE